MCANFRDVRCFGYTLATKADGADGKDGNSSISVGLVGPVTIMDAKSVQPIMPMTTQITKCMSMDGGKGSDTIGTKYRVDNAAYVVKGSINPRLADKTHMTEDDVEAIKEAIKKMFWNDVSAARPAGSMEVKSLYWMEHDSKLGAMSSAAAHRAIEIQPQKEYPFFTATVNKEKLGDHITVEEWQD